MLRASDRPRTNWAIGRGVRGVAIYRLLANAAFDPAKVSVMIEAYECACKALDLIGAKTDPLTELVAKKIVEITQSEVEPDAQAICDRSLQALGITKH